MLLNFPLQLVGRCIRALGDCGQPGKRPLQPGPGLQRLHCGELAFPFPHRHHFMNFHKLAVSAAISAALLCAVPVLAAEDPAHFLLSPGLLNKLKAAEADMKALHQPGEAQAPEDDQDHSIEASIGKIDRDTNTTAVLKKHGLSSRELVLSAHAMLHAGMYIAAEIEDPRKAGQTYAGYTTEQKANIAIVRAFASPKKR